MASGSDGRRRADGSGSLTPMDEDAVRSSARAVGDALVAGNVDAAIEYLSDELKRNPGEIIARPPPPARRAPTRASRRAQTGPSDRVGRVSRAKRPSGGRNARASGPRPAG